MVGGVKAAVLLALVLGVGCGKTSNEAANKLFVEATKQMAEAVSKDDWGDADGAVADYGKVLVKVRKIVSDYPESDIAVKLVSGEALFTGKSLEEIEERVDELKSKAEEQRIAEERRRVEEPRRKAEEQRRKWEEQRRVEEQRIAEERRQLESIKDPIEKAIREAANKPTGELTEADMEKMTRLKLRSKLLTDVTDLEKLEKLNSLDLYDNQLTDVKGLEKLKQLTWLRLSDNQLTDVKTLEKLTQLEWLFLSNNQLTDVKGLENLPQLTELNLRDNPALTKAQIAELQKALPKCHIESNPTK